MRVALLISCLVDQRFPRVGFAVAAVLEKFGCEVIVPPGQTCCGLPLLHAGLADEAKALARRTVELFESAEYVVTPSPACCGMVRERYPDLLPDDPAYEAGMWAVAGKTYEFTEFLRDVLKADLAGLSVPPTRVTYQPSCQLRTLRVADPTPALLKAVGGVTLVSLPGAERCCGFGGPFSRDFPAVADAMRAEKLAAIERTKSDTTVCNECGCSMYLTDGGAAAPRHVAEILAEAAGAF